MTNNPSDALSGAPGFAMRALLLPAQHMKDDLATAQEALASAEFEGSAGGVSVTVTGVGELKAVRIATGRFDGGDEDSLTDLADLVVAAFRDAKAKADATSEESIGMITGGLSRGFPGMPGGGNPGTPGQLGF
ncbi:YbaB/EbfC family nucleoid-associated protein [Nocardioides sp.]|uniref:YbaB/EbfC family nucleoid-associated protein n=1 Tax=Nocardioides sp. TaxID=35761 RepID=UPI0026184A89|nr:YbaB/EbfC family nucleoid-associated protein [Nocardioides sp.]